MAKNRRVFYLLSLLALVLPSSGRALANADSAILISEVQTGSTTAAGEEFIELFNSIDQPIDVSAYRLEYFPATAANFDSPTRTIPLHGVLASAKYYLVASNNYLMDTANDHYSATLAKAGGHVRLVSPNPLSSDQVIVHDLVGWGTAAMPEGQAATAPDGGQSLQRQIDPQGFFVDSDNNQSDFAISTTPSPQSDGTAPAAEAENQPTPPATTPNTDPTQNAAEESPEPSTPLLPLRISELLPNPAPPQTDAEDEFVEVYNPNPEPVDLDGYKLQTGNSYSYSFTFTNQTAGANVYTAFYVSQTNTLLANSGGRARLINPGGQIISEATAYEEADDGQAWALINSVWQWTSTPTPGAANVLSFTQTPGAASTSAKKIAAKVKAAKKTTAKSSTKKVAAATARNTYQPPPGNQSSAPLHPGVLAAIGGLTLAYGGYEYRHDLANRLQKLRRYRATRRTSGQTP